MKLTLGTRGDQAQHFPNTNTNGLVLVGEARTGNRPMGGDTLAGQPQPTAYRHPRLLVLTARSTRGEVPNLLWGFWLQPESVPWDNMGPRGPEHPFGARGARNSKVGFVMSVEGCMLSIIHQRAQSPQSDIETQDGRLQCHKAWRAPAQRHPKATPQGPGSRTRAETNATRAASRAKRARGDHV